jgi:hypothetical protein
MTRQSSPALGAALLLLLLVPAASAETKRPEPLAIKLSAYMAPARSDVIVRMRVEPDVRSRELTVEWIGDDLSGGSHAITLEGARAAANHQFALKQMTPGQYVVTAILRLNDGTEVRRASTLTVVGVGGPDRLGGAGAQGSAGGRLRPATRP